MNAKIFCTVLIVASTGCFKTGVETTTSTESLPSCQAACDAGFACNTKSNSCVFVGFGSQDVKDSVDLGSWWLDTPQDVPKDTEKKDTGPKDVPIADVGPCNALCKNGEKCDQLTHKCYVPCKLTNSWAWDVQKVTKLSFAAADQGCDLNGDGKPDNAIGKAVANFKQVGDAMTKAIADGSLVLLFESTAPGYKTDGSAFDINMLTGAPDPKIPFCDYANQTSNCGYLVDAAQYDTAGKGLVCPPTRVLKKATIQQSILSASGPMFPLIHFNTLGLATGMLISQAKVTGSTTDALTWKSTNSGQICGYILASDFNVAGPGQLVKCDIVSPNSPDGLPDACSIALDFETGPGQITGYK